MGGREPWLLPMPAARRSLERPPARAPGGRRRSGRRPGRHATAIALARLGWSVTILERSHFESTRIGKTLPPDIKQSLIALGVWEAVSGR